MKTEHIKITDTVAQEKDLCRAADVLRSGGLVVFPTETVYGLGGNATRDEAAKKIYAAKGRPSDNPLIIHIADPADAEPYAVTNALYYRLAKAFMPGPLTVILPRKNTIPKSTTGGLDSVAVRCPSHPVAHKLIELCGFPIAAPSANLSGKPSPTSAAHVAQDMDGRVDMILDGGESEIGLESTIVKIEGDGLILLRPGGITRDALSLLCDKVTVADAVLHQLAENERPLSPGMKYRHYAPTAPLVLLSGNEADVLRYLQTEAASRKCAILCYDEECAALAGSILFPVGKKNDLAKQAHRLFAALREADGTDAEIIYAHLPPQDGLGLALYNRLIRAAAHTVKEV
ncbi:MAG: threonylcarbamoyl-AMP synthase [Clostridia bacterium]|nr:threonylcarbamoyl-AMP synthase [Clostridia bacterium]